MIAQTKTIQNVEIAKELSRRMRQPTVQDRVGLARAGLALLKQAEPVNGEAKQVARAANRLANALKAEYGTPNSMGAASVAVELRTFAGSVAPFGKSRVDLIVTPCLMG